MRIIGMVVLMSISSVHLAVGQQSPTLKLLAMAANGTATEVRDAIAMGANVEARDMFGYTPLMLAAYKGSPDTVRALLTAHANAQDTNKQEGGLTALMIAAASNPNVEVTKLLLDAGSSVESVIESKTTGFIAIDANQAHDSSLFAYDGLGVSGDTALMLALKNTNIQVVETLIKAGASVEARDAIGTTALMLVAYQRNADQMAKLLIHWGANVEDRDIHGYTPLMYAAGDGNSVPLIDTLLAAGANPADRQENGFSAVEIAATNSNIEILKELLNHGGTIDAPSKTNGGFSPLIMAVMSSNIDAVQFLLSHGPDVHLKSDLTNFHDTENVIGPDFRTTGISALMFTAFAFNHAKAIEGIVRALLAAGEPIDERSGNGMTALMYVAEYGRSAETLLSLLSAHADPNLKSLAGKTAWDYIQQNDNLKDSSAYWALNNARFH